MESQTSNKEKSYSCLPKIPILYAKFRVAKYADTQIGLSRRRICQIQEGRLKEGLGRNMETVANFIVWLRSLPLMVPQGEEGERSGEGKEKFLFIPGWEERRIHHCLKFWGNSIRFT